MDAVLSAAFFPAPCGGSASGFRGWHVYAAAGLSKQGFRSIAMNPVSCGSVSLDVVDGVPVLGIPIDVGRSWPLRVINGAIKGLLGYDMELSGLSLHYGEVLRDLSEGAVLYLHGYHRRSEAWLALRKLSPSMNGETKLILQNHASPPPHGLRNGNPIRKSIWYVREDELRRLRAFFFALTEAEKRYLEGLGAEFVKVRPMAVNFDSLIPASEERKTIIKRELGLDEDSIYVVMYGGGLEKGVHYAPLIHGELQRRFKSRLIVTGIPDHQEGIWRWLESHGVTAFLKSRLSHSDYLKLVSASSAFIMPARSSIIYGGITVSVMEALAMGIPVVSPTLIHFPDLHRMKEVGVATRFVDEPRDLLDFLDEVVWVLENRDSFNPSRIHELGQLYYSWEAFSRDFSEAVTSLS
ncbi:glycosyltransferase [Thermocladium modestius]|uniref:glycosyltransferase n=1 Tax=Thermocladium modestius TaxID=62609 RepID=UPI00166CDA07|nr:glycosyltransferase [Thermocladium modestius]